MTNGIKVPNKKNKFKFQTLLIDCIDSFDLVILCDCVDTVTSHTLTFKVNTWSKSASGSAVMAKKKQNLGEKKFRVEIFVLILFFWP